MTADIKISWNNIFFLFTAVSVKYTLTKVQLWRVLRVVEHCIILCKTVVEMVQNDNMKKNNKWNKINPSICNAEGILSMHIVFTNNSYTKFCWGTLAF